eukprot:m.221729 g.221729  ORF g.221729 m.221729 type:complete len:365 (+) comp15617_c0_seq5:15-1109(+)
MMGASSALMVTAVLGHGFVIFPPARNAIDKDLPLFANGSFPTTTGKPGCTPDTGACGCWCTNGTDTCQPGQSCFWFSQGCSIECPTCLGVDGSARWQKDLCNNSAQATVCDSALRTYNMDAPCNSQADTYKHNPWRHPGTAPVFDACGKAGGGITGGKVGGGAAFYTNTIHAKEGDLGSKVLPPMPSGVTIKAGSTFDATWSMRANHGGGYQYRLCSAKSELSESCFQQTPLPFAGVQMLQYANGTRQTIPSVYAYPNGTGAFSYLDRAVPTAAGAWARNPIPDHTQMGSTSKSATEFPPPCVDDLSPPTLGLCSGERPFHLAIVDQIIVPATTPPGDYVLGFRWDCEETAQIWASCSDISITE